MKTPEPSHIRLVNSCAEDQVPSASESVEEEDAADAREPDLYERALERWRSRFSAVPPNELKPITIDVIGFATLVLRTARRLLPMEARLGMLLRARPVDASVMALSTLGDPLLTELQCLARATLQAHAICLAVVEPNTELAQIRKAASVMRKRLRGDVKTLVTRGLLPANFLDNLNGVKGHRNTARDLLLLVALLRRHWPSISNKCAITADELNTAHQLASVLCSTAPREKKGPQHIEAALLRARAFTVLYRAYNELRQCVAFLEPDQCERLAPSPYKGRKRPSATRSEKGSRDPIPGI